MLISTGTYDDRLGLHLQNTSRANLIVYYTLNLTKFNKSYLRFSNTNLAMSTYPMQMYIGTTQSQKITFFTITFILHDHIINDVMRPIKLKLDDLI